MHRVGCHRRQARSRSYWSAGQAEHMPMRLMMPSYGSVYEDRQQYAWSGLACRRLLVTKMKADHRQQVYTACVYFVFECDRFEHVGQGWTGLIGELRL